MREMIDELKEKACSENAEDRLELSNMSKKERRKFKKEKRKETMKDMSKLEKFNYLLFYYKWPAIIILILVIALLKISITIYKGSRPVGLSYAIINCSNTEAFNSEEIDKYLKSNDLISGYQNLSDLDIQLDPETYVNELNSYTSTSQYQEFAMECFNGYFDIAITDKKGATYCGMQDIFYHLDLILDADLYNKIKDRIYKTADHDGNIQEFAIDISDTAFAKSLNLGYEDVYIGFPGNKATNIQSAKRFLSYILSE